MGKVEQVKESSGSNSEGEPLPPKTLKRLKRRGKVLSFSTLSSMMERAVGKAVEHNFQQVLPTLLPAKSPRKATRKLRHIMEDSSSEEELGMIRGRTLPKRRSQTKTIKGARVLSSEEDSEGEQIPSKLGKKSTWLGSFKDESLSHHSSSDKEDGELSEDGDHSSSLASNRFDRLCPTDLYHRVMAKAAKAIDLPVPESTPQSASLSSRAKTYPQGPPKPPQIPFPEALNQLLTSEWVSPAHARSNKVIDKLYSLPEQGMKRLKTPSVDAPVAAVSSATVLPSEGESGPKDGVDRRVESTLKKNFEATSQAFRASVASSIFSRATFVWSEELAKSEPTLSKRSKCTLKKMALASAAAADCAYDAMQLVARSMGLSVMARRHIWLRNWQGDPLSSSRVVNLSFKGEKLFGKDLEPLLVEDSEKRKVLPSKKVQTKKSYPFRSFSSGPKFRGNAQGSKPRWDKGKTPFRPRRQGGQSSSGSQSGKAPKTQQSS